MLPLCLNVLNCGRCSRFKKLQLPKNLADKISGVCSNCTRSLHFSSGLAVLSSRLKEVHGFLLLTTYDFFVPCDCFPLCVALLTPTGLLWLRNGKAAENGSVN